MGVIGKWESGGPGDDVTVDALIEQFLKKTVGAARI